MDPLSSAPTLERFSRSARLTHWLLAGPFIVLLATGFLLYVPRLKALQLGGYRLLPLLHIIAGAGMTAGLIVALLLQPSAARVRRDIGQLFRQEPGDGTWLRWAVYAVLGARLKQPAVGRFNAGQKLNTLVVTLFTTGLIATGAVLAVNFFTKRVFGAQLVENVYSWHDDFMYVALPIVAGHIFLAALNPSTRASLRGMLDGRVDARWAKHHHPLWVAAVERSQAERSQNEETRNSY